MNLMLGKNPPDPDQLKKLPSLYSLLPRRLPSVQESFDVDQALGKDIPNLLGANDKWGGCVVVGRANHTLRLECREQGCILPITDKDILHEYYKEGGATRCNPKPDHGLVVQKSLECWKKGWRAAGKRYDILGFARMDDPEEFRVAITYLYGAEFGLSLPTAARRQFEQGEPWDAVLGFDTAPGSWGGHLVYAPAYCPAGITCVTWGKDQLMTWPFIAKYADEIVCVVDNRNSRSSVLDVEKLVAIMAEIEAG